jgi:ubiquinone/menaquinone biosynthesis C-methylase UbiE
MDHANAVPLAEAIEVVKALQPNDILEIGFGSGRGIVGLLRACPESRLCGVDGSADMVARASARLARAAPPASKVQLVRARADALPWGAETFDCALAVNVAYFFGRAGDEMAEIFRVLRPGGHLVVYVTRSDAMARWPFASRETHRHFDNGELRALFDDAGFGGITIRAVPLPLAITGLIGLGIKPTAAPVPAEKQFCDRQA